MFRRFALAATFSLAALPALAGQFTLSSPDIADGKSMAERHVLAGFGCTGGNLSPALAWHDAPAGTKSFALTVYDPDAPTGSGWWHWVVFNCRPPPPRSPPGPGPGRRRRCLTRRCKAAPTSAPRAMAARARPPARRIATSSPSTPSTWRHCRWIRRHLRPWSASWSTPTAWAKPA